VGEIQHRMFMVDRHPAGHLYACPHDGCGRRLIINPVDGSLDVIDAGDRDALHHGSSGEVELSASIDD